MSKQPTALYLAEILQSEPGAVADAASAELRRLHALNGELLEALKALCESHSRFSGGVWDKARADIKKAEGEV
jgi:hypothetical protein